MFRIGKTMTFEAAHHLIEVPEDHQCRRPHGHSYVVEVDVESETLTEQDWVVDYGELSAVVKRLDHRDLNEIVDPNPTAELIALWLYTQWKLAMPITATVTRVLVRETATSWAEYRPGR